MRYAALDRLVDQRGHDWIYDTLMERLSGGESPAEIAGQFGVTWVVLRGWIEEHCPDAVALAGRARADMLEWEATDVVRNADKETVAVSKLQRDHYMDLAKRLDKEKYGDKVVSEVNVSVLDSTDTATLLAMKEEMEKMMLRGKVVDVVEGELVSEEVLYEV